MLKHSCNGNYSRSNSFDLDKVYGPNPNCSEALPIIPLLHITSAQRNCSFYLEVSRTTVEVLYGHRHLSFPNSKIWYFAVVKNTCINTCITFKVPGKRKKPITALFRYAGKFELCRQIGNGVNVAVLYSSSGRIEQESSAAVVTSASHHSSLVIHLTM